MTASNQTATLVSLGTGAAVGLVLAVAIDGAGIQTRVILGLILGAVDRRKNWPASSMIEG
ncbi:MAG: hypothetical protein O3A21_03015 [Proteobacteria bacterium]|nr:hypothetical protein [Pseudomonadota bacterium]